MRYLIAGLAGAVAMFFWDPDRGAYRRSATRERLIRIARRQPTHVQGAQPPDEDEMLAEKIDTEVFRDRAIPKGNVGVTCVDGVAFLRGEVERPDLVELIDARVRRVSGVRDVVNLLTAGTTTAR